jgi:polygalacturonase
VSELSVTVTPDPHVANTDGIDVIGSSGAILIFLNFSNGGDSVALKSGLPLNVPITDDPNEADLPQLPTHDVQIINSKFANGNGIVVGGEAANGVYNVLANNITGNGIGHGLLIKSDRIGGNQTTGDYNIWAQNMTLTDVRQPLAISAYDGSGGGAVEPPYDRPQPVTPTTPNIHDITIKNVTATGATEASRIVGLPESCIRNVVLDDVKITTSGAGLQLRNMTGKFTNVTSTQFGGGPPFVVQENVTVATAGTTPAITNTPALASTTTPAEQPCGGHPEN